MSEQARRVLSYIELAEQVGFDPQEYCWCCRAFVNPITPGCCPWCERQIEQVDLTHLPPRREDGTLEPTRPVMLIASQKPRKPKGVKEVLFDTHLDARHQVLEHYATHHSRLHAGQLAVRLGVPFSSPESAAGSLLALLRREGWMDGCYKGSPAAVRAALDAGTWNRVRDPGPPAGGRRGISEALIHEALWLYLYEELSFRLVAERLIGRTTYKNVGILKRCLNLEWWQRGWPRRSFHAASRLKGYTMPAENAGRCVATSRNGKPCTRWANKTSSYCTGHDPERAEERRRLGAIASRAAYADAVDTAPFAHWLRARVPEVGSVAAMHRRICDGAEKLGKARPIDYWQFVQWIAPRSGNPCSGHKQRGLKVRRQTVDRILEGWGDGTTFEDIYCPEDVAA